MDLSTVDTECLLVDQQDALITRLKKSKRTRYALILVAGLFVLGCVIFAIIHAVEASHSKSRPNAPDPDTDNPAARTPQPTPKPTPKPSPKRNLVCNTSECFSLTKELSKRMNKNVNPCHDFYSYACGGWQQIHALNVNETYMSGFKMLAENNYKVLKNALETATTNYSKNEAVMKTVQVYNSCLNTSAIEARGSQPLRDLIKEYGGWSVTRDFDSNFGTLKRMGKVLRELNVHSFLGIDAITDAYDSSKVILRFSPAKLGMNYKFYFSMDADKKKVRDAYVRYMKAVGKELGVVFGENRMMEIYNFELKLAKIASGKDPDDELIDFLRASRQSRSTLTDFRKTLSSFGLDSGFSTTNFLLPYLQTVFNRAFSRYVKVLAFGNTYFQRLASIYSSERSTTISNYIMWRVVNEYISTTSSTLRNLRQSYMTAYTGAPPLPRWKQCISQMMKPFAMPLGLLFVDSHFDDDAKTTVVEMTRLVRAAFINKLPSQTWMDWSTQRQAGVKARAIKEDVGYPSSIKDPVKLAARYKTFHPSDQLFENFRAMKHFLRMKNINTYGKPVDKDEWKLGPAEVNGYYSPKQNRIVLLAGIIQSPFYEAEFPRYLNYGALGTVIGHEITHGFDSSGRLFNKNGDLDDWWSKDSTYNFHTRTKCLIRQYNNYKVFDKYEKGSRILNENIADNGAIKFSYEAYQLWVKKHGQEKVLPGLGLTSEQLFFVGFAQPYCSIYTKTPAYRQLEIDVHAFNKYRVIGSLSNYDKFSQVFNCPWGSRMNPFSKCSVW